MQLAPRARATPAFVRGKAQNNRRNERGPNKLAQWARDNIADYEPRYEDYYSEPDSDRESDRPHYWGDSAVPRTPHMPHVAGPESHEERHTRFRNWRARVLPQVRKARRQARAHERRERAERAAFLEHMHDLDVRAVRCQAELAYPGMAMRWWMVDYESRHTLSCWHGVFDVRETKREARWLPLDRTHHKTTSWIWRFIAAREIGEIEARAALRLPAVVLSHVSKSI